MRQETENRINSFESQLSKFSYLIVAVFFLTLSLFIAGYFLIEPLEKLGMREILSGAIASQSGILLFGLMLFGFNKSEMLNPFNDLNFKTFWYGVRATVVILFINVLLTSILPQGNGDTPSTTQNIIQDQSFMITFLLPVVIAPIAEEFAFRAGLKYLLIDKGKWHKASYIFTSSIIFGLMHWTPGAPTALIHVLLTTCIGVVYSIVYLKTKNIYIPIVSHMLYNGLVVTLATLI